jgi:hypothetical protein
VLISDNAPCVDELDQSGLPGDEERDPAGTRAEILLHAGQLPVRAVA